LSEDYSKLLTLSKLKWLLSALAAVASFYDALGHQRQCEKVYSKYIKLVDATHGSDSIESANAYFMVGAYYYEQEQYLKSLASFVKARHLLSLN
jgi:tetratricopeptide (TPR) repeat protein